MKKNKLVFFLSAILYLVSCKEDCPSFNAALLPYLPYDTVNSVKFTNKLDTISLNVGFRKTEEYKEDCQCSCDASAAAWFRSSLINFGYELRELEMIEIVFSTFPSSDWGYVKFTDTTNTLNINLTYYHDKTPNYVYKIHIEKYTGVTKFYTLSPKDTFYLIEKE